MTMFQEETLEEVMVAAYPHAFECYKRIFSEQHLLLTYGIMPSVQIQSLPENSGWNFVERKYKFQWFEGEGDISPTSIEYV